jgi:hypothetical protein
MCMGIPEGRGNIMGGSHMGKVKIVLLVPIKIKFKIRFNLTVPIAIFYFTGSN